MTKPIILEIDNVRIGRWDDNNLFVEREETTRSYDREKKVWMENTGYKFKGYYSTLAQALSAIHAKGLLINENSISDLTDVLKQVMDSEKRVVDAISRLYAKFERGQ